MAPKSLKILFVTPEVIPFTKTGGLADVSSALPQKLLQSGHQIRILTPKYGAIDERKHKIHEVVRLKDIPTQIAGKDITFSLRSSFLPGQKTRVQLYFLDNQEYFGSRFSLYMDPISGVDFHDNDERFILLAKSVIELIDRLGWYPDIIHCNDWQTGLIPAYVKLASQTKETFKKIKTLFTIHNIAIQGIFPKSTCKKIELPVGDCVDSKITIKDKPNFLKAGLVYADSISTVSESFAEEISSSAEMSYGLNDLLFSRKENLFGILNGIDQSIWNPEKDKLIPKKYSIDKLENKLVNRQSLAEKFNIEVDENTPIIGNISRLYDSKGFDLIKKSFKQLMKLPIKLIILGTGDKKYHEFFDEMAFEFRDKFTFYPGFDDNIAHLIEAGSDIYLMPSKSEPCGLNQMYSMNYGTIPIVHSTGGLKDTVTPFNIETSKGTGFLFNNYTTTDLINTLEAAINLFINDRKNWKKIMINGMTTDFSWENSAENYVNLYKQIITK